MIHLQYILDNSSMYILNKNRALPLNNNQIHKTQSYIIHNLQIDLRSMKTSQKQIGIFLLMMKLMSLSDMLQAAKAAHPSCGAFLQKILRLLSTYKVNLYASSESHMFLKMLTVCEAEFLKMNGLLITMADFKYVLLVFKRQSICQEFESAGVFCSIKKSQY